MPAIGLFLSLLLGLPLWPLVWEGAAMDEQAAVIQKTERLLNEFFVHANQSGNPALSERTLRLERALKEHQIQVNVPPSDSGDPIRGAEFLLDEDHQPFLVLKKDLIKLYPRHKSYVFAVLMHESFHASDYLVDPERFLARHKGNELELYLYEMDATYLEARFILDVSKPKGWRLSAFEEHLLGSLEKDNLASISTAFRMVDMDFVYTFYKLRSGTLPLREVGARLVQAGRDMKGDFLKSQKGSEWDRYRALVSIRSFVTLGPNLATNLIVGRNPKVDPKDAIEKHIPGYDPTILELQDILIQNQNLPSYNETLVKKYNESFL